MKHRIFIILLVLTGFFTGCNKNDGASIEIALQNEPPLSFDLYNIENEATEVDIYPSFSWESAKNPAGDEVTYDLYLDTKTNPTKVYSSDISEITFKVEERLKLAEDYYWKVIAKDKDGRISQSEIRKFSTRHLNIPEDAIVASAEFLPRFRHTSVVFKDKLWVIGGEIGPINYANDVWYSATGETWEQATNNAGFSGRLGHTSVVFDGKIWVIGGFQDLSYTNDVWYSEDGISWVMATDEATFSPRSGHTSVVFDDKIWVMGGGSLWTVFNDVWFTDDGITWTQAEPNTVFPERFGHNAVVFDDKIWVMGGAAASELNDVWSSSDGESWVEENTTQSFNQRRNASANVLDDKIYIMGGKNTFQQLNNIWFSNNGADWTWLDADNTIFTRSGHTSTVFKDKIWMIGGEKHSDEALLNDVWVFD